MKKLLCFMMVAAMMLATAACGDKKDSTNSATSNEATTQTETKQDTVSKQEEDTMSEYPFELITTKEPIPATIEIEGYGTVKLELYPDIAPISVSNFQHLANSGYYDGLTFHRIIEGFMIQGGCPLGNGTGGPGYHIKGEFIQNGVPNSLSHTKGVISMARSSMPDSAGSQFFIMHEDAPYLDGQYAAFGKVISGQEVVDAVATVETNVGDAPINPVVIQSVKVG